MPAKSKEVSKKKYRRLRKVKKRRRRKKDRNSIGASTKHNFHKDMVVPDILRGPFFF